MQADPTPPELRLPERPTPSPHAPSARSRRRSSRRAPPRADPARPIALRRPISRPSDLAWPRSGRPCPGSLSSAFARDFGADRSACQCFPFRVLLFGSLVDYVSVPEIISRLPNQ
ncbi:leucine-rich repeat extensin-like protein 4 [Iris pallida]|uniref:Leucine-rich repeat extensin-like protein 4 n=1 Tax=Iris pallida TaxID=29817 RepID=A0AAX6HCN7_IRIPA|nr:leucine-rich repeat extensin-like protein 4 [Iris pallida]KAJ6838634.1 leucine-rich repeat extensin-like protein 4 [Iris pallida]